MKAIELYRVNAERIDLVLLDFVDAGHVGD
jgi:hypothetical protein